MSFLSPTPFADLVADTVAPWNDQAGFWDTYNRALAAMFELVYDIVADRGDPEQTVIATLSASLSMDTPITSLPVLNVAIPDDVLSEGGVDGPPVPLSPPVISDQPGPPTPFGTLGTNTFGIGANVVTVSATNSSQGFVVTAPFQQGDTSIQIEATTPNYPYPTGSPVQLPYFPGWAVLLDPYDCPDQFLPFLAQFNGTDVPTGTDPVIARAKILSESGLQRGTVATIAAAVRRNLRGTQNVSVMERIEPSGNPNGYWFLVVVRPEDIISIQTLTDAVNAVKPGGVQWTLIQTDAWIISGLESAPYANLTALEAAFVTVTGLEQDQPGT